MSSTMTGIGMILTTVEGVGTVEGINENLMHTTSLNLF